MTEQARNRLLAFLLALVICFSVLYIALEADHDCSGEDCVVCALLGVCERLLRLLLPAAGLAAAGLSGARTVSAAGLTAAVAIRRLTLITLKVKLSD